MAVIEFGKIDTIMGNYRKKKFLLAMVITINNCEQRNRRVLQSTNHSLKPVKCTDAQLRLFYYNYYYLLRRRFNVLLMKSIRTCFRPHMNCKTATIYYILSVN